MKDEAKIALATLGILVSLMICFFRLCECAETVARHDCKESK